MFRSDDGSCGLSQLLDSCLDVGLGSEAGSVLVGSSGIGEGAIVDGSIGFIKMDTGNGGLGDGLGKGFLLIGAAGNGVFSGAHSLRWLLPRIDWQSEGDNTAGIVARRV